MRLGFHLLYNQLAWAYDGVSWLVSLGRWTSWQLVSLNHLDLREIDRILELAHGTGNLQAALALRGIATVGLDISPNMSRHARSKMTSASLPIRLVRANAGRLPFPRQSFRAVVTTFPTEFIFARSTLGEVKRVLTAGGKLVVVVGGTITKFKIVAGFLELLYKLTGQTHWRADMLKPFSEAGLPAELIIDDLGDSRVWTVVASKS